MKKSKEKAQDGRTGLTLGGRVADLRGTEAQASFARRLGVGQSTVSALERDDERHKPSAELLFKLGSLAQDPQQAIWFWEKAGLDRRAILAVAEKIRKGRSGAAREGDVVRVGALPGTEDIGEILVDRAIAKNPDFTYYFKVDEGASQLVLLPGIVIIDTSRAGADLEPFWDEVVLAKLAEGSERWQYHPDLPAHGYVLGKLWCAAPNVPNARNALYIRHGTLAGRAYPTWGVPKLIVGSHYHPHFQRSDFLELHAANDREGRNVNADTEAGARKMRAQEGWEIIGRVTGWFPESAIKAK